MAMPGHSGFLWRQMRIARCMTQQDVADALVGLAWRHERRRVGVNADMVSKWERGDKRPSALYRRLLSLLFDLPATAITPARLSAGDDHPSSGGEVPASKAPATPPASDPTLLPAIHEMWKDELMKRRSLLKLMGVLPLTGSEGVADWVLATTNPSPVIADGATVRHLRVLAQTYQRLYHTAEPAELALPVLALVHTTSGLLTEPLDADSRRELVSVHAQASLLAGRLAFFDLQDRAEARTRFSAVLDGAKELDDHVLAAAALGHMAFLPAAERNLGAALEYLSRMRAHAERAAISLVESWSRAVESELHARAGQPDAAMKALDRAAEATQRQSPAPPEWFDFYDCGRLEGFRGYALLQAGRDEQARHALEFALTDLPRQAAKQRAVLLADLATAYLRSNDLLRACHLAGAAAVELRQAGYATGIERLKSFRQDVRPWGRHRAVRELEDRLAGI